MEEDVENRGFLGKVQHGFRKGKRATDAVFTLTQIIEKYKKKKKSLALAFLDVKKAYDKSMEGKGCGLLWRSGDMVASCCH